MRCSREYIVITQLKLSTKNFAQKDYVHIAHGQNMVPAIANVAPGISCAENYISKEIRNRPSETPLAQTPLHVPSKRSCASCGCDATSGAGCASCVHDASDEPRA
jgi:hypothetical protein